MANTNLLKTVVEKEIIGTYCEKHCASEILMSKRELKCILGNVTILEQGYTEETAL